jgi:hypothetical protein
MTQPTYFATKYDSARDEVIALLADELSGYGMRDDTFGDVTDYGLFAALVVIPGGIHWTPAQDDPYSGGGRRSAHRLAQLARVRVRPDLRRRADRAA